jgi:hypothetical protein
LNDLIPASKSERLRLPERSTAPKNTISFEQLTGIAANSEAQGVDPATVLKEFISRLPKED